MSTLEYKGFTGSIEVDLEDQLLFGKVLLINDLVSYEGQTLPELKASFESAVDDYLAQCEATGKPANKPLSGLFNVRVGEDLHRQAVLYAHRNALTLNKVVIKALECLFMPAQQHVHRHEVVVKPDEQWMHRATTVRHEYLQVVTSNDYPHHH